MKKDEQGEKKNVSEEKKINEIISLTRWTSTGEKILRTVDRPRPVKEFRGRGVALDIEKRTVSLLNELFRNLSNYNLSQKK